MQNRVTTREINAAMNSKGFRVYFDESEKFYSMVLARPNLSEPFTGGWKMEYAISFEKSQLDAAFEVGGQFIANTKRKYARQFILRAIWNRCLEMGIFNQPEFEK